MSKKTRILIEYSDFSNIFFLDSASELLEYTRINDHPINLLDNKQSSYGLIYSLGLVELEILKTYIETNLANSFIRLSKSFASCLISFVWKKNSYLYLCINYQKLNNLTIKNYYLLLLIGKLLNYLDCTNYFIQLTPRAKQ